jgi:hypothetical protein
MSNGTSLHPESHTIPGANLEMIRIDTIRESNAQVKGLEDHVAVFIGGMLVIYPSVRHKNVWH